MKVETRKAFKKNPISLAGTGGYSSLTTYLPSTAIRYDSYLGIVNIRKESDE